MQLLIDDRNPGIERRRGIGKRHLFAANGQRAGRRRVVAAEDLQQRGFPRAVLPHQGVDLAGIAVEADIGQRVNTGESFPDAAKREIRIRLSHNVSVIPVVCTSGPSRCMRGTITAYYLPPSPFFASSSLKLSRVISTTSVTSVNFGGSAPLVTQL